MTGAYYLDGEGGSVIDTGEEIEAEVIATGFEDLRAIRGGQIDYFVGSRVLPGVVTQHAQLVAAIMRQVA